MTVAARDDTLISEPPPACRRRPCSRIRWWRPPHDERKGAPDRTRYPRDRARRLSSARQHGSRDPLTGSPKQLERIVRGGIREARRVHSELETEVKKGRHGGPK